jgi:hypothetical protein
MKKTDARQESWAQGENTMRFRKETIEWKDDSTNISRKEQVVVSRLTHTMGVYENYEREIPEPRKRYGQMEQKD